VPFVEPHTGDIEESSPVFHIPGSQWTEIVAQEDMLEKLNHEKPEQSQGIQESVQSIEDGGPPQKPRIDSCLDSILIPRSHDLMRGSGGRRELSQISVEISCQ